MTYSPLTVLSTREELGGAAKTVVFNVSDWDRWAWKAGQHLPIRLTINGQEVRRSYSISSSPYSGDGLRISVKRVKDGLASNFINDTITAGDVIEAAAPNGRFVLQPEPANRRTHYFFGAGSGITPLYAMLGSVMAAEPHSFAHLAYGNRNENTILLKDEINALWQANAGRMSLHHVFTKPGWWSSAPYWRTGYIDQAAVAAFIAENPPFAQDAQYYICGPAGMNQSVKTALMALDVPAIRIHMESYVGSETSDASIDGVAAQAQVHLGGGQQTVAIAQGQTILDAVKEAGLKPPYSCQSGVCGSCRASLKDGHVHMRHRMALDDKDIAAGTILTCQSVPTTQTLTLDYE